MSSGTKEAINLQTKAIPRTAVRNEILVNFRRVRRVGTTGQNSNSVGPMDNGAASSGVANSNDESSEHQRRSSVDEQMPSPNFDEEDEQLEAAEDETVEKRALGKVILTKASVKAFEDRIHDRALSFIKTNGLMPSGKGKNHKAEKKSNKKQTLEKGLNHKEEKKSKKHQEKEINKTAG